MSAAPVAHLDLASAALTMARAAADRRRGRKAPLTRREALAEAPWVPEMAASGVDQRAFRAAYADRLVERGIALPSTAELPRPSGPSGRALHPEMRVRVPAADQARYRAIAERRGMTLSEWVRAALERAARK